MIYHTRKKNAHNNHGNLDDLGKTVGDAIKTLRPLADEFDSIVVTGMSGVVVGTPVSLALKRPVVILRKTEDDAHGGRNYSSDSPEGRFINLSRMGTRVCFLDDFIGVGNTRERVMEMLKKCPGVSVTVEYMYRENRAQRVFV